VLQLTEAGQNGQSGTSAAPRVVEVKGHARANVTGRHLRTEVARVTEIRSSRTRVTTYLVQVTISS